MVDMNGPLMSSLKTEYETPHDLFNNLNKIYHFTLDPAATDANAKCEMYFTQGEDGLSKPWYGNVWLNPPYGRILTPIWVEKVYEEVVELGNADMAMVLLPARTDTIWFHKFVMYAESIGFIKGRLKFVGEKDAAPFPSMLVYFSSEKFIGDTPHIYSCDKVGNAV